MVCRNIKLLYKYYFVKTQKTSTKLNYNLISMEWKIDCVLNLLFV